MRKITWLILVSLLLGLLPVSVGAQDGGPATIVELDGGYAIIVPDGWTVQETGDTTTLVNGDLVIEIFTPDVVISTFAPPPVAEVAGVLITAHEQMRGDVLDPARVILETIDGRALASTEFAIPDESRSAITVVLEVEPDRYALMEFRALVDEYPVTVGEAFQIMLTLQPAVVAPPVTGLPCAVSTTQEDVNLRVGPGTNRGIYQEMEIGPVVPVLGKATDGDNNLWWRLDTETGDAAELWVADVDVVTQGDCALVVDVDAPPIIFAPPAVDGDGDGSGETPTGEGLVACTIVNTAAYPINGSLTGPGGSYGFTIAGYDYQVLRVVPGSYQVSYTCSDCATPSGSGTWSCAARYNYIQIPVIVTSLN